MTQQPSVKQHPKYNEMVSLLDEGHSTRYIATKLNVDRIVVCQVSRSDYKSNNPNRK